MVPGEAITGYHAVVGFIAFTLIVLGAKLLRVFIRRDESYYAPNSVDAEFYPDAGLERLTHGGDAVSNHQGDDGAAPNEENESVLRSNTRGVDDA